MKKLIVLLLAVVITVSLFRLNDADPVFTSNESQQTKTTLPSSSDSSNVPPQNRKFATKKLKKLTIADKQCEDKNLDFSSQIANIHQVLIDALEQELQQGRTDRELLAYSSQYKVFYSGFDDLLLRARINIEKPKYNITSSSSVLSEWKGLAVIEGFNSINVPIIVEELKRLEGQSLGLNMGLTLKQDIAKSDIYDLLDNNKNFNTYLESPLSIGSSPVLSPSILFLFTATKLDIEEYKHAISMHSFTVHDIAIAMQNDMDNEYLIPLITQTNALQDMPLFVQGDYESYNNLADLAAAKHNTQVLEILEKYGVKPTNEPGIITGLDLAIMNLPDIIKAKTNSGILSDSDLSTLKYLIEKGYKAHGSSHQTEGQKVITFKAPFRRSFHSDGTVDTMLRELLERIELIDSSFDIVQIAPDHSSISNAIETIELRKAVLNDSSTSCATIRQELLAEEGFEDMRVAFEIINDIKKNNDDIPERLHEIDPVLVNLWRNSDSYKHSEARQESAFIKLFADQQYQLALEYSVMTPLTLEETDTLLQLMMIHTADLLPVWNARTSPQPPSGLFSFRYLEIEKWQFLLNEGFDFSERDRFNNDIFLPAVLHSTEAVSLLLDNGFKPYTEGLGLDAFDVLLDESYEKGRLNPNVGAVINVISNFEPSHYSRIARLKKFFPDEYTKLIKLNKDLEPGIETEINKFRLNH